MYEEKRFIRKKISWSSVFLKLLLIILIAFLIWFLIYKHKTNKNTLKGHSMNENLTYLKEQSIKYFNEDNLPKYTNEKYKVTLEQMIKDGASKEIIDKDGNKCSSLSSYSQVTKIDSSNYNLKVYIKCKNEADSILTTVTKSTFINSKGNSKSTKSTDTKKNTETNKTTDIIKETDTNKTTNTIENIETNKTSETTKKTNKTTSKTTSSNTSKSTSSTSSSKTTSTSGKSKSSSTSSSTGSSTSSSTGSSTSSSKGSSSSTSTGSSSTGTTPSTPTTPSTTEYKPEESKLLYTEYRLIKYVDWQYEKPTSGYYKTSTISIVYNRYCYATDYENCHVIPNVNKYKKDIEYFLMQGFEEIYDHTDKIPVYLPYELIWSRTKDLPGYTYTGDHREFYVK